MNANPTPSTTPWPSAPSSPSSPSSRRGRRAGRTSVDRPAPRDAADVLAAVYGLILTWPTPEEAARPESAAEAAGGER
jgi:hypothetical protein